MPPRLALVALGQVLDNAETLPGHRPGRGLGKVYALSPRPRGRPSPLFTEIAEARQAIEAATVQQAASPGSLAQRLAGLSVAEQERAVLEMVCQVAAAMLGLASADAIRTGAVFRDLCFDSLTEVQFRNQLRAMTGLQLARHAGLRLPHPQVHGAVALCPRSGKTRRRRWLPYSPGSTGESDLAAADVDRDARTRITLRLNVLLEKWKGVRNRPVIRLSSASSNRQHRRKSCALSIPNSTCIEISRLEK